ncbi:MAG TPA: glucose 1-dehydrogenase [Steroidobacteraceae bacterium]|nr:glucose 1-dehydrogenase [Steroidobacteraceae bacterium]
MSHPVQTADFAGKVALVTGGGSGIGRAAARAFAAAGARVVVAGRGRANGEETVRLVSEAGGVARFLTTDVADSGSVRRTVEKTVELFGRLDCAFNNAGMPSPEPATVADLPEETWNRMIAVNLTGVFHCMKWEIRQMLKQGTGSIVNCASIGGLKGSANAPAYIASKHGVIGLTRSSALDYARKGIRINAVCPGLTATPMLEHYLEVSPPERKAQVAASTPIGRIGRPEEVAAAVLWLCSDQASLLTGVALPADGGSMAG